MVKKRKLLKKVMSGSKNIRFGELTALMEAFGFTLERISGSHHIFSHPDIPQSVSVQPSGNGQAKPYQIKQFLKVVETFELSLEDDAPESDNENAENEDDV